MAAKSIFKKYIRIGDAEATPLTEDLMNLISVGGEVKRTGTEVPAQIGDYLVKDAGKNLIVEKAEFEKHFKLKFPGTAGKAKKPASQVVEVPQAQAQGAEAGTGTPAAG